MKLNRLQALLIASAAFLAGAAAATWPWFSRGATRALQRLPNTSTAREVNLNARVPELSVESESLDRVVDDLARQTGQSFAIDWSNLAYGAHEEDRKLWVSLRLRNVTLREALDALV